MAGRPILRTFLFATFSFALGCKSNAVETPTGDAGVQDGGSPDTGLVDSGDGSTQAAATQVNMDFARVAGWLAAPFPSDDLLHPDGTIDLSGVPNPKMIAIVTGAVTLLARDARGFSLTGGAFFTLTGALDPSKMPSLATSIADGSPVFLMSVDDTAPDFLKRYPVDITFATDGGPFGGPNLLSIVPLQGIPLRPHTLYAAVVLTTLGDATGAALGVSTGMADLAAGQRPAGMNDAGYAAYTRAIGALGKANIALSNVAGLAAFTTDAPMAGLTLVKNDMLSRPAPLPSTPFALTDTFPTYCVYQSTLGMPEYQAGTPPYALTGGGWAFDATGKPVVQRTESAQIIITVPRAPMPTNGFPVTVFVRAGGGGNRPLIDRGVQATATGPAIEPGTGPALYFARQGIAGVSVEGPLGGSRNPTGGDEDTLIFNVVNPVALRDNIRQSGAELILLAHSLSGLTLDASGCPGVTGGPVVFDTTKLALMSHSLGSTIAPLALSLEPAYRAAILSGAGASYIANILYKLQPVAFRPTFEALLGYTQTQRVLVEGDPILTLFQWATESSDPLVYTRGIVQEPASGESARHILMEQGIVDHYIMPPIANAMTLSLGLDLAGDELDSKSMELANLTPLSAVLPYSGRKAIALPASANAGGGSSPVTAVVVQHPEDGITDGHEIVFQTDPPKREYECYLATFLKGTPVVVNGNLPDGGTQDAGCP